MRTGLAESAVLHSVLSVANLKTYFHLDEGVLKAVDGVSFDVRQRETLGMIGESGCGKSVTAQSVLRIVPKPGATVAGSARFHGRGEQPVDLLSLGPASEEIRHIRGRQISMIFQEPMTSLSPIHTIGAQIMEMVMLHRTRDRKEARDICLDMIDRVGISNPRQRIDEYPHQLSGGIRQRAMIAMALSCNPTLLIADEPTTALDVTIQAQILDLMRGLQQQFDMSILYITHDLGVIAEISDRVAVMYLGRMVEYADTRTIFRDPQHPYTRLLLKSIPKIGRKARTRLEAIKGTVPIPMDPRPECGFFSRCPDARVGVCDGGVPDLIEVEPDHWVRCVMAEAKDESHA